MAKIFYGELLVKFQFGNILKEKFRDLKVIMIGVQTSKAQLTRQEYLIMYIAGGIMSSLTSVTFQRLRGKSAGIKIVCALFFNVFFSFSPLYPLFLSH